MNNITHLCFANDFIPFSQANNDSVGHIKAILTTFHFWSRLQTNPSKSNMYFFEVSLEEKQQLLCTLWYKEGDILFK